MYFFLRIEEKMENIYKKYCTEPSDINEHLPILYKYAAKCIHVTEMGVRSGKSTAALLAAKPKKLISYDIQPFAHEANFRALAKGTEFVFKKQNVLEVEIENTELLFIDTWHTYSQLNMELYLHGNKASKYIIMHDTETYGVDGEDKQQGTGLLKAIYDFLEKNTQWSTELILKNNNGLFVLCRTK